jgi:hypothetical protein
MVKVREKGYRLLDPSCSRDAAASAAQEAKPRWILTATLNDFLVPAAAPNAPMGSVLTASLFDTQSSKEVWRDTAKTGWGGRFASNLLGNSPIGAVESGIGPVLAKFEKRKSTFPPTQATMWAPMSLLVRVVKGHSFGPGCNGLLRLDSGTLSFEPSSNGKDDAKCAKFQFSLPGIQIKTYPTVRMLGIPGKGNYVLQQAYATQDPYLFVALDNLR